MKLTIYVFSLIFIFAMMKCEPFFRKRTYKEVDRVILFIITKILPFRKDSKRFDSKKMNSTSNVKPSVKKLNTTSTLKPDEKIDKDNLAKNKKNEKQIQKDIKKIGTVLNDKEPVKRNEGLNKNVTKDKVGNILQNNQNKQVNQNIQNNSNNKANNNLNNQNNRNNIGNNIVNNNKQTKNNKQITFAPIRKINSMNNINAPNANNINAPNANNINEPNANNINAPNMKNINAPNMKNINAPNMKNINAPNMLNPEHPSVESVEFALTQAPIMESVEFALPEIMINNHHKIENFYPYFLKANLINLNPNPIQESIPTLNPIQELNPNLGPIPTQALNPTLGPIPNPTMNMNPLNSELEYRSIKDISPMENQSIMLNCLDSMCEVCHINNKMTCLQCLPGNFLLEGKCYNACPDNYLADIYKRECAPLALRTRNTFSRTAYVKAFSTGSCANMCGKIMSDCSCQPVCAHSGNCCSDYRECEVLARYNIDKKDECEKKIPNCEMCLNLSSPNAKCGQCKPGFFLRNGECLQFCDKEDKAIKENMICMKSQRCLVENCAECEEENPSVCKQCMNGTYLHNNMCHIFCPGVLKADRMNWICMEPSVFSWHWIFPSKSTCRNNCDKTIGNGMDCSCRDDCVRYGNCCQDIEEYCYKFILS